jgi:hypothetical protein
MKMSNLSEKKNVKNEQEPNKIFFFWNKEHKSVKTKQKKRIKFFIYFN